MRIGKIQNNQITFINVLQETVLDSVTINVFKDECWINGKILKEHMYLNMDDMVFFLDPSVHHFAGYALQDEITIGRENCDINIASSYISCQHALIREGKIYDLGSVNGIYVNHKRVTETSLQVGDLIDCIFLHIAVVRNCLLIQVDPIVQVNLKSFALLSITKETAFVEKCSQLILEPDLPNSISFSQESSLWLSILPSLSMSSTILVSNFLSNDSISANQWILYIGMFLSMGILPVIARVYERNRRKKQEKENRENYLLYLKELENTIQKEIEKQERYERESLDHLHIGLEDHAAHIQFHLPKVNYEMNQNELYLQMLSMTKKEFLLKNVPQTICLTEIVELSITGKYAQPYLVYLFDHLTRCSIKVKIIGEFPKELSYLRFLHHLYFNENQSDQESLIIVFDQQYEKAGRKIYYNSTKHGQLLDIQDHSFFPEITEEQFLLDNDVCFLEKLQKYTGLDHGLTSYISPVQYTHHLKVPIGIGETGNVVELDLHEKGHGPHGLVAGMTGSGKSEFLITLVLSLAYTYSPEIVTFMLIDYKGGGLSDVFNRENYRLPHLRSTLTNLEEENIERVIYALKKEITFREKLFSDLKLRLNLSKLDIDDYIDLYTAKKTQTNLSHLVIIVDEFAELKTQYESLIQEMIHISRIGRSLGLHLILATQKPSGVVNQQIWSNASFHICLKVQDSSDSLEMIHQKDAAYLESSGEFYLQLGPGDKLIYGKSFYTQKKKANKISLSIRTGKENKMCECDEILTYLQKYQIARPLWKDFEKALKPDLLPSRNMICIGLIDDYKQVLVKCLEFKIGDNLLVITQDILDYRQLLKDVEDAINRSEMNTKIHNIHHFMDENQQVDVSSQVLYLEMNEMIDFSMEKKIESYLNDANITVICCISSLSSMKYGLQKYFIYKLVFQLNSQDDYRLLFGNRKLKVPQRQGWGLVYLDDLYEFKLV